MSASTGAIEGYGRGWEHQGEGMDGPYRWFVGVDLGSQEHVACVTDGGERLVQRFAVTHSGAGVGQLVERLWTICEGRCGEMAVSLESRWSACAEALMERGFPVFVINPKQLDRLRDRFSVAGAKDDSRDALVLSVTLRTDQQRYRRLEPADPALLKLRELSRLHDELSDELHRACNRLQQTLHRYYPQMLVLSSGADEPLVWDLLEAACSPGKLWALSRGKVTRILKANRIRRFTAEDVLKALKVAPLPVAPGVSEACVLSVEARLPQIRLLHRQLSSNDKALEECLRSLDTPEEEQNREHRDVAILRSLPGVGPIVAATVLAEAAEPLAHRDYSTLRCLAGTAPVTRASGKTRNVLMRRACNGRLRDAMYHMARVGMQVDDGLRTRYLTLRSRGLTHSRALRGLADRMLAVLMAMLRTCTLYDPSRWLPEESNV